MMTNTGTTIITQPKKRNLLESTVDEIIERSCTVDRSFADTLPLTTDEVWSFKSEIPVPKKTLKCFVFGVLRKILNKEKTLKEASSILTKSECRYMYALLQEITGWLKIRSIDFWVIHG